MTELPLSNLIDILILPLTGENMLIPGDCIDFTDEKIQLIRNGVPIEMIPGITQISLVCKKPADRRNLATFIASFYSLTAIRDTLKPLVYRLQ